MKDIADRAGVSTVTVSKALSGQRGVSQKVREQILQLAEEMGYQPAEKQKSTRISYTVGIIVAEHFLGKVTSFYGEMLLKISEEIARMECISKTELITDRMEGSAFLPKILGESLDGLIALGSLPERYLEKIRAETDIPVVCLDHAPVSPEMDCVVSDGFYGTYQLTNHLFAMGHQRIGYVGTLFSTKSITERYLGYYWSLMEHGQQVREDWILRDRENGSEAAGGDLFILPEKLPTAFVCNSDYTAACLCSVLKEKGLRCPEDISITGYDNFAYPWICDQLFTTYEVNAVKMVKKAVSILLHRMNGDYMRKGIRCVTGHLIERDSVRKLN